LRSLLLLLLTALSMTSCPQHKQEVQNLHPLFNISEKELMESISDLPAATREKIAAKAQIFLDLILQLPESPEDLLILVDKEHTLGKQYIPPDLINLQGYSLSLAGNKLELRRMIIPDLLAMVESSREQGIELVISSAYRSYSRQESIYNYNVRSLGREIADRESAKPGHSQHQLGTTIDFGSIDDSFASHPAGIWLSEHGWQFGFSLSYPPDSEKITGYRYEPWHYRYIGRHGARITREFFLDQQQYFLEFWKQKSSFFQKKRVR